MYGHQAFTQEAGAQVSRILANASELSEHHTIDDRSSKSNISTDGTQTRPEKYKDHADTSDMRKDGHRVQIGASDSECVGEVPLICNM